MLMADRQRHQRVPYHRPVHLLLMLILAKHAAKRVLKQVGILASNPGLRKVSMCVPYPLTWILWCLQAALHFAVL